MRQLTIQRKLIGSFAIMPMAQFDGDVDAIVAENLVLDEAASIDRAAFDAARNAMSAAVLAGELQALVGGGTVAAGHAAHSSAPAAPAPGRTPTIAPTPAPVSHTTPGDSLFGDVDGQPKQHALNGTR